MGNGSSWAADHIIDQSSPIPLHYQLRQFLRRQIESGVYRPGDQFPTSRELREQYHLSATTVERALAWLVERGLIYRRAGRGTVVSAPLVTVQLTRLIGIPEAAEAQGLEFTGRVLRAEFCKPTERQAEIFALRDGDEVLHLDRLISVGADQSTSIHFGVYPPDVGERFMAEPALIQGSLYKGIEQVFGWQIGRASQTIGATVANHRQAQLLHVQTGAALIRFDRIVYLTDGRSVESVRCYYPAARFEFHAWLERRNGVAAHLSFGSRRVAAVVDDDTWEE